ncbi:Acetyltransferase, GNAT family [Chitinispirillum alkaliphilum]|nr:Acetyltransferase, GNAT family [Chitinispirillum alkaliphilum]
MITIREATPEEIEHIALFQLKLAWETESVKLDYPTVLSGVKAVFDDRAKGVYYIAENDNRPVASALTVTEWSDWRNGDVVWIHSVYVIEQFRRQGIFSSLYKHIKENVISKDELKGIRLYVDRTNQKAQKVYESLQMNGDHYKLFEWMKE